MFLYTERGGMKQSIGFPPIIQKDAKLVVLGSFPGRVSLQLQQYYALPRNQFWRMVGAILNYEKLSELGYVEKVKFLREHQIGLWDVYESCVREGSLDSSIRAGKPNDLLLLKKFAPHLKVVAHNGKESAKFESSIAMLGVETIVLPSTSPAYASMSFDEKCKRWRGAFMLAGIL